MDKNYRNYKLQEDDEQMSLRGKTPDEVEHYLLSGEPDDLSIENFED